MMTLQAERRQDRMSKLTDTQKMLICVLVDVLLVALVWIFAFTPLGDKCSDAENDIAALQSDIDRLQDLVDQKDSFIEKTQVLNADTDTIIDKYGAGNTPEKILMFLVDLSKESNMTIPSISFGEETNVTVLSDGTPLSEASSDSSSEGDEVSVEYDYDSDSYCVYNYDLIGYVPKSKSSIFEDNECDACIALIEFNDETEKSDVYINVVIR